jgi:hypothetical protein
MPPKKQQEPQKIKPEITQRAEPKVTQYMQAPSMGKTKRQHYLYNKITGKTTPMTLHSASSWARKYPNEYEVR